MERANTSHYAAGAPSPIYVQNLKQITMSELEHATHNFSQSNVIGEGRFGLVHKGLLQDGTRVAIKRYLNTQVHFFLHEVKHLFRTDAGEQLKMFGFKLCFSVDLNLCVCITVTF